MATVINQTIPPSSFLDPCLVSRPLYPTYPVPIVKEQGINFKLIRPTLYETIVFKDPSCKFTGVTYVKQETAKFKLLEPPTCPIINLSQEHCERCGKMTPFRAGETPIVNVQDA